MRLAPRRGPLPIPLLWLLCAATLPCAPAGARAQARPARPTADPLSEGIALFRQRRFADALPLLLRAHEARPGAADVQLLLGIAYYRTGDLQRAEGLLTQAAAAADPETEAAARLFLSQVHEALGATDQARRELDRVAASARLGARARGLAAGLQKRRLQGVFVLSPEVDGNVPLTDLAAYQTDASASTDADLLLLGTLVYRPLPQIGLTLGLSLSHRQQLRLHRYTLTLGSAWLGYAYLGRTHRVRASATFHYAAMGGGTLFLDGEARAWYRLQLPARLGLSASYTGRYRSYRQTEYEAFSGHTHALQGELTWGEAQDRFSAALGYLGQREAISAGNPADADFSAWAHGPLLRLRAQLHSRVEASLLSGVQLRRFDAMPAGGDLRRDAYLYADLSLSVNMTRWLELFAGFTIGYNQSNDAAFTYVKPIGYLGLSMSFAAF